MLVVPAWTGTAGSNEGGKGVPVVAWRTRRKVAEKVDEEAMHGGSLIYSSTAKTNQKAAVFNAATVFHGVRKGDA